MGKSGPEWRWYVTASLLPLPFYLCREISKRAAIALVPWIAILLPLDIRQIFFRNPYLYYNYNNWADMTLSAIAYAGVLLTLPNFVSWIDGDGAFPKWQISFKNFSRIFFASCLAWLFLLMLFTVLTFGAGLADIIGGGFRAFLRFIVRNFAVAAFAVWGAVFCWAAGEERLLGVLERYVLRLFSCFLPLLSAFTMFFFMALPMGMDRLWRRGISSEIILCVVLVSGLCAVAGWQGGVAEDGKLREPFIRPVNIFVKLLLVTLPIYCPILVYAVGLRLKDYGWTVNRMISMTLAVSFGLWTLAWAFCLVRKWKDWPEFYGRVNRIAFPALGLALILLSSPLCDARRIVLSRRLEWLRKSVGSGGNISNFDWRYTARNLGIYGISAMEELEKGGVAGIRGKFGPFEDSSQAAQILDRIAAEVVAVKKEKEKRESRGSVSDYESGRKTAVANFLLSARDAPVFGGELGPDERERLVRGLPENTLLSLSNGGAKIDFFCLTDMNGNGEHDVLLGLGDEIHLLREGRAFQLSLATMSYGGARTDNKTAISADRHRIIGNRWNMLRINDKIFYVNPGDIIKIDTEALTRGE
jgi:hypothetical protein